MIGPRNKRSISQRKTKTSAWKAKKVIKLQNKTAIVKCKNCGKYKLTHRVCPHCGFLGGKQVLTIKSKDKVVEA